MLLKKRNDRQFSLENSQVKTQKVFLTKKREMCTEWVNATKDFPECQNGIGCLYDLIKRAIFETLVRSKWVNKP